MATDTLTRDTLTQEEMAVVYQRPDALTPVVTHYCPGCTHGVGNRLVAEVLSELGLIERTIGVASVGCSVFAYNYFECDFVEAAHGRAPAMATGIKRLYPDHVIFTYQGDGDLASIGTAEIVHAALEEALKLETALSQLHVAERVVLLHYSPIVATVVGEAPELYPFLGSSRLEEPINRYAVMAVFHGHAHAGSAEGRTSTGVPVYNVSVPVLQQAFADRPPFRIVEIPVEWVRDDAAYLMMNRFQGLRPYTGPREIFDIFRREFESAYADGGLFQLTMHPHVIGYRSRIWILEELISVMREKNVWFASHADIARWVKRDLV